MDLVVALILPLLAWKMASETQQGADSYPLYKRRSPEDGG